MSAKTRSAEDSWVRDLRGSAMARGRPMAYARRNGGWPGVAGGGRARVDAARGRTSSQDKRPGQPRCTGRIATVTDNGTTPHTKPRAQSHGARHIAQ